MEERYEIPGKKMSVWERTKMEIKCVVEDMCLRIPKGEIFGIHYY